MREKIERSLLDQLAAGGADIEAFRALIADYMAMYDICEQLKEDITEHGTIISAVGSMGQDILKPNPSLKELRDTNKAMLGILKQLGLSIDKVHTAEDDVL